MLAAPPKAIYAAAVKTIKSADPETSSVRSNAGSTHGPIRSVHTSVKKLMFSAGGSAMEKSRSEQSSLSQHSHFQREDSGEYESLKQELGQKGLGRILRTIGEGIVSTGFR
jgi:hypothetical protein